jgi:methyl-accepting chemotaxis protein
MRAQTNILYRIMHIRLSRQITIGLAVICLLFMVLGVGSFLGIHQMINKADESMKAAAALAEMKDMEAAHLKWVATVGETLLQEFHKGMKVTVEKDDHKCGFGKWLYGEGRRRFERQFPALAPLVKKLEAPHHALHNSVYAINENLLEAEDMEGAKDDFREETQPALHQLLGNYDELVRRLETIKESGEVAVKKTANMVQTMVVVIVVFGFVIALIVAFWVRWVFRREVGGEVEDMREILQRIAGGDLTVEIDTRKSPPGSMMLSLNEVKDGLAGIAGDIHGSVDNLTVASNELTDLAGRVGEAATNTSEKSNTVAAAAEEMSVNMNSVAAATGSTAENINMVAAATEEMTSTVGEIAQSTEKTRNISETAVDRVRQAAVKVDELGRAAQEVGKVTAVISEISEQTNLLSLNATIEAARAGEAGKGFAVVANEIKELARQTADATQDISKIITEIQGSIELTVGEISEVTKVIEEVNGLVTSVAAAIEEQSATTREIAGSIAQASQGIAEINENISQSTAVAGEISADIASVSSVAGELTQSSTEVNTSADNLKRLGAELREVVQRFKLEDAS